MCLWKPFPNNQGDVHMRKVEDCMKETCYYSEAYKLNDKGWTSGSAEEKSKIRGKPIRRK